MLIYRTANRNPGEFEDAGGFLPKNYRSKGQIKTEFMEWCRTGKVVKMVERHQSSALGSGYIISMDMTKLCGGYSKKFFYELNVSGLRRIPFTADVLGVKQLSWKGIQQKPENVHLYMSATKLKYAEIFAISNIGDRKKELSVFSWVPFKYFSNYAKNKAGPYKPIKNRKEYPKPVRGSINDRAKIFGKTVSRTHK
ncbi:hypothetical protein [Candidatus Thiodiazotropha sp. CDECU1]|uniref:hypothetical protein n=1 Tax=Candidatus Thiodiazotropha sp. CDECU1 TaxID=3065865 RepID=UPI00292EF73C|nr:hypothetical protein [Candidatus Thiodiazotropha sp. CDECU1]